MERLWSPWRMAYVRSAAAQEDPGSCFLCDALAGGDDRAALVLARDAQAFAILNAFPYNPGHVLVAPNRHVGELEALREEESAGATELVRGSVRALREASAPDGFNIGMNLGRVAGAGVPGHLHWHVVPRWNGDTNFMGVVGDTKVLPELLSETWERLKPFFGPTDQPA